MNITTIPLLFLSNAVRVAHTPDEVLANAGRPMSDDQRKAVFAKMGGGGGGGRGGGASFARTTAQAMTVAKPSTGGKSYSWSVAAPAGLAEAQAQNAQWLGSQLAAGRTVTPAGGGQITAEGTWTPQGGFVPHSPEVLQAMATTRAQIAFNSSSNSRCSNVLPPPLTKTWLEGVGRVPRRLSCRAIRAAWCIPAELRTSMRGRGATSTKPNPET